mmetsp:Transcript_45146/g.96392  ORF Transcript_45146/g.96392 Transcript_45146/m.96392 type:complete len:189 (+) Transcript_45146:112-678(+)
MEAAMKSFKDKADFEVKWRPFFLNPSLPKEGVDKLTMYKEKFGEARMQQMIPHMQQVGRDSGINFSYGGKVANTMDSHRVMNWALKQSVAAQDAVCEKLFAAYFEQEKNIGSEDVLVNCAKEAGVDAEACRQMLREGGETQEVLDDIEGFQRKMRISGVPHFVINGKEQLSGAQEADTFAGIFEKIVR